MREDTGFERFIDNYFHRIFWPLLLGMLVLQMFIQRDKPYLITATAPEGYYSLENVKDSAEFNKIKRFWESNRDTASSKINSTCPCDSPWYAYRYEKSYPKADSIIAAKNIINRSEQAKAVIILKIFFIIFYSWLLLMLVCKLSRSINSVLFFNLLLLAPVFAGLLDLWIKGMLYYYLFKAPASRFIGIWLNLLRSFQGLIIIFVIFVYILIRLASLGILAGWYDYLNAKLHQVKRYRAIFVSLLLFSLPIWISDQGQDLLINISANSYSVFIFTLIIVTAAFLNWWIAKLFFRNEYADPLLPYVEPPIDDLVQERIEKKASRFLGVLTFLSPAFAMLNAMDNFKIHYAMNFFSPIIWLVLTIALFYIIIRLDLITRLIETIQSRHGGRILLGIIVLLLFLLTFFPRIVWKVYSRTNSESSDPAYLGFLSLDLICMAVLFLVFVTVRNDIIPVNWGWLRKKIGIPIYALVVLLCILFLAYNIAPLCVSENISWNFFCLPVLFSGIVFYTMLYTFLLRVGQKSGLNVALVLFLFFLLFNVIAHTRYHNVRTPRRPSGVSMSKPQKLEDYFAGWVEHRKAEIDTCRGNYPVFLVNAYGGGIRAAAFTSLAIQHLNDSVKKWTGSGMNFDHLVFSYSGASGGTIGEAIECAYRYGALLNGTIDSLNPKRLKDLYNQDFLTTLVAGMAGRDIWAAVTGTDFWDDRASVQESLWEYRVAKELQTRFDMNFYTYWDTVLAATRYEVPLLFSNTTNVDDGLKGIMCPVTLNHKDFPSVVLVGELIPKGETMLLSTGSFLSSRFPILTPSGKMSDGVHFVDGGLKDNSGAETSLSIFLALEKFRSDTGFLKRHPGLTSTLQKLRFFFVSMGNTSHSKSGPEKKVRNYFELTTALVTLYNSGVDGNAHKTDSTLRFRFDSVYASIWPDVDCIKLYDSIMYSPGLPLGWQISQPALDRLDSSTTKSFYYNNISDSFPQFGRVKKFIKDCKK